MTGMQIFWAVVVVGALVAFFFAIRTQMRQRDSAAGVVTPADMNKSMGMDSPDIHSGEGSGEKTADEYETITNTLGHG